MLSLDRIFVLDLHSLEKKKKKALDKQPSRKEKKTNENYNENLYFSIVSSEKVFMNRRTHLPAKVFVFVSSRSHIVSWQNVLVAKSNITVELIKADFGNSQ